MSEKRCKRVWCDYEGCEEHVYLEELDAQEVDMDGGYTRYNRYKYEEKPEGWKHFYVPDSRHDVDLCPKHSAMYEEIIAPFISRLG